LFAFSRRDIFSIRSGSRVRKQYHAARTSASYAQLWRIILRETGLIETRNGIARAFLSLMLHNDRLSREWRSNYDERGSLRLDSILYRYIADITVRREIFILDLEHVAFSAFRNCGPEMPRHQAFVLRTDGRSMFVSMCGFLSIDYRIPQSAWSMRKNRLRDRHIALPLRGRVRKIALVIKQLRTHGGR